MKTKVLAKIYKTHGDSVSNTTIYKEVSMILGAYNDKRFRHCIRGLQQGLKKCKMLVRTGSGMWQYVK